MLRNTQEAPGKHPGNTQETLGKHPGKVHLLIFWIKGVSLAKVVGTFNKVREREKNAMEYPGNTWETPGKHPGNTRETPGKGTFTNFLN